VAHRHRVRTARVRVKRISGAGNQLIDLVLEKQGPLAKCLIFISRLSRNSLNVFFGLTSLMTFGIFQSSAISPRT
jgi:hypothetical protein